MRLILIEANELKKILPKFILEEAEAYIDETEEIEAIPIEWIGKWVDMLKERNYHNYTILMPALIEMIEKWEKENER